MCTIELKKMEFKKIIEQVFENKLDITILFWSSQQIIKGLLVKACVSYLNESCLF